jgi:integron integrase
MNYVGIDYHKRYSVVTAIDEKGQVIRTKRLDNRHEPFQAFFSSLDGPSEAVLEATRTWGVLYDLLEETDGVESVTLAHSLKVRAIAEAKIKTDKIDSHTLAQLLRVDLIPAAYIPSKETRSFKDMIRQRVFLVRMRTRLKNRIHVLLDRRHIPPPPVTDIFGKGGTSYRKTLQHYANWTRKYQCYLLHKDPTSLSPQDVKRYLTYLAVDCKVSSSTQNLAFNALLFLYRHVLKKDFGDHKDIPRAKKSTYVPVVLSRDEVQEILARLGQPYHLIAKLQYGCGLRCFEAVKVRVKDLNFDAGLLTVKGKGGKSRSVPLPNRIVPELFAQLTFVKKLHVDDLAAGYSGVFLEDQLEKKYPNAPKEFQWQWFFPQESLTVASTGEKRRYHVHDSRFQDAMYFAAKKAQLTKRVTTHTLRHSFATHLLQANYDIRTIQTLLGHSDVRTTMIYTHCVPSRTVKEAKSPLDF